MCRNSKIDSCRSWSDGIATVVNADVSSDFMQLLQKNVGVKNDVHIRNRWLDAPCSADLPSCEEPKQLCKHSIMLISSCVHVCV